MQDAHYLRSQAQLCLAMARELSDRQAADNLRAQAAHYFARAVAAESGTAKS